MKRGKWGKHIWEDQDIKFLKDNYRAMTNRELAAGLGIKLTTCRTKLYELGLKRMEMEYWTQEQIQFLKNNFGELWNALSTTLHCEYTFNKAKVIYHEPDSFNEVQRAWAFWVCTNMSFAAEAAGSFQWVRNKTDNWHPAISVDNRKKEFGIYKGRLDRVTIMDRPAERMIPDRDGLDTFFYLDPPYVGARQGHYGGYTQDNFNELLKCAENMKGMFLMSSYQNNELDKYVNRNGWKQKEIDQRLGVSGGAQRKTEVLTWNYD
tara:strand:+ start:5351 stop:6139 length:789 start_codon:yes stop_codon:yes gene_type:complete